MIRKIAYGLLSISILSLMAIIVFVIFLTSSSNSLNTAQQLTATAAVATEVEEETALPTLQPSPTEAPATPTPTVTNTLLPPPTFEPATSTPVPSETPSPTPTATLLLQVDIPGLNGAETPTPTSTPGCEVDADWQLTYEVQANDTLTDIANRYGLYPNELANGNCLTDANVISVGQTIHVPGSAHPVEAAYDCSWEVLTPIQNAFEISGEGTLTFNWIGPDAYRNMVRVIEEDDGEVFEWVIDLRQNLTIDLEELPDGGRYTWYVYPLDEYFVQIPCQEGGPWVFNKDYMPDPTETPSSP